jgi:Xaa-Pro aminopeptidase
MDIRLASGGYCSDMTRTIAFAPVSEEMRRVYDTVLRAQLAGIERSARECPAATSTPPPAP